MSDLIAGHITSDESDPWNVLMESLGRAMITVRCLTERRLPYTDAHGKAEELVIPKESTIELHYNLPGMHTYQELRGMASRHALLSIEAGFYRMTLLNDNTLQCRSPTPQDVRQAALGRSV